MNYNSQRWFKDAYDLVKDIFPFGYLTGLVTPEDVLRLYPTITPEKAGILVNHLSKFFKTLPSKKDFIEEKGKVTKKLIPNLKKLFPYVDSAISFGTLRGDLDIGLISNEYNSQGISNILLQNKTILREFPILDLEALDYFVSKNGKSLAEKIIETRKIIHGPTLSYEEINYIYSTFNSARLLFGKENHLNEIKNYSIA